MSVLLKAYSKNNLGDDLFIKIITNRYKEQFILVNGKKNISFKKIKNLKIVKSLWDKILNKCVYKYSKLELYLTKKTKMTILLGGSMFIQYDDIECVKKRNEFYKKIYNEYYIIGSNFGPFKDNCFFEEYLSVFKNAQDICFRENKSYEMFKPYTQNVRVANDIVFSLKNDFSDEVNEKIVIISVIDCQKKIGNDLNEKYKGVMQLFIDYFLKKKYKIILMSFCQYEGDEKIINEIMKNNKKKNVEKYFYRGNIDEALKIIANASVIVGSRFHANILGMVYNKCIIPIAYSDKTINVLKDLKYKNPIFDIRKFNIRDFNIIMNKIDWKYRPDISNAIIKSEEHFKKIDKVLGEKDE